MEQNVGGAAFGLAIVVIIAQLAALALGAGALRLSLRPDAPIHPAAAVFATVWALSVAGAWLQVTLAAALGGTLGWGRSTAQSVPALEPSRLRRRVSSGERGRRRTRKVQS